MPLTGSMGSCKHGRCCRASVPATTGARLKILTGPWNLIGLVLAALLFAAPIPAQVFDGEFPLYAGGVRLERPASLAVSENGEQIAVCDPQVNRIAVLDYTGRPLWSAGDRIDLGRPIAAAFVGEHELIFTRRADPLILRISRENPTVIDTVANPGAATNPDRRLHQLVPLGEAGWLALDRETGELLEFASDWTLKDIPVPHGSGKGKTLVPTSVCRLDDGRIVITDRKNFPGQLLSPAGKHILYFGWSSPDSQRGWEATAAAVDSRDVVWIADETNGVYRLFDAAGGEIRQVSFPNPLFRPMAMTGTIDNRVLTISEDGRAIFYSLE